MLRVIQGIYRNRSFTVRDAGCTSSPHQQLFGICQGCPLSPFLFVMVMSVLMHDAKQQLQAHPRYYRQAGDEIEELLYADDTLLIHSNPEIVKLYMECVRIAGMNYGLSFNWKKLENMPIRCDAEFFSPNGDPIQRKRSFKYLGSMLCHDGKVGTELSCRLGAAKSEFEALRRVWSHAAISKSKRLRIYEACIVSKLTYCFYSVWLRAAELNKLDAFHHKCLRRIAGVQPSFYSRISNQTVRDMLRAKPLRQTILKQQLLYFGEIASRQTGSVTRDTIFLPNSVCLKPLNAKRRRGRPRASWAKELHTTALKIAGGEPALQRMWTGTPAAKSSWRAAVIKFCYDLAE